MLSDAVVLTQSTEGSVCAILNVHISKLALQILVTGLEVPQGQFLLFTKKRVTLVLKA